MCQYARRALLKHTGHPGCRLAVKLNHPQGTVRIGRRRTVWQLEHILRLPCIERIFTAERKVLPIEYGHNIAGGDRAERYAAVIICKEIGRILTYIDSYRISSDRAVIHIHNEQCSLKLLSRGRIKAEIEYHRAVKQIFAELPVSYACGDHSRGLALSGRFKFGMSLAAAVCTQFEHIIVIYKRHRLIYYRSAIAMNTDSYRRTTDYRRRKLELKSIHN